MVTMQKDQPTTLTAAPTTRRPEAELLLVCAVIRSEHERGHRIREIVEGGIDWAYLLWIAHPQGMLPLLYRQLERAAPDLVPGNVLRQLETNYRNNVSRRQSALDELREVLRLFAAHGIAAVPIKEPFLGHRVYDDPGLRQFEPLDILMRERDVHRARALLAGRGYRSVYRLTPAQAAALRQTRCAAIMHQDDRGVRLHLYDRFAPPFVPFRANSNDVWTRMQWITVDGEEFPCLSPEDLLQVLSVHGAINLWERLSWICDVARLIESHPSMDWQGVMQRARAAHGGRMLLLALHLARELLGAYLPPAVLQRVQADPVVAQLGEKVRARLYRETPGPAGDVERSLFRLQVADAPLDKVHYTLRFGVTPTVDEWKTLQLPDPLFPAYYVVRPVRLLSRQVKKALRRKKPVPFYPSPIEVVDRMLELAAVTGDDVVYDLGCGDGRMVIQAAKRFGARGVGVDIDADLIARAKANARAAGVDHLVTFIRQDALTLDLTPATVVMLWMLQSFNIRLRPKLQTQLRPGARVVAHGFDLGDWKPMHTELIPLTNNLAVAYLWRIEQSPNGVVSAT
jgi:hypothetical protein